MTNKVVRPIFEVRDGRPTGKVYMSVDELWADVQQRMTAKSGPPCKHGWRICLRCRPDPKAWWAEK